MHSFLFPTCVRDIIPKVFLHSFACGNSLVFKKKRFFFDYQHFFLSEEIRHSDISNHIFWKSIKNKGNVALDTFLDFADITSYFTFKVSAWKRGSTISFAQLMYNLCTELGDPILAMLQQPIQILQAFEPFDYFL